MKIRQIVAATLLIGGALAATSASAFVIGPTSPGKWGPPAFGTGASVTYSFMPTGTSCAAEGSGCTTVTALADFMPFGFKSRIVAALNAWSLVADLTFTEVTDDGAAFNAPTTSGDLRFGGHVFDGQFGVLAHGFFPPNNGDTAAGDMHYDKDDLWKLAFGGDPTAFDIFQVTAHEIGHALGEHDQPS